MQPERAVGQVQAVIEQDLFDGGRVAQMVLLEGQCVGVKRLVTLNLMACGVTLLQVIGQAILCDQLMHLILQRLRVGLQVFEWSLAGYSHGALAWNRKSPFYSKPPFFKPAGSKCPGKCKASSATIG